MNNAKMWLVVPPAVGVPVFLGAVAAGSFAVHVAVVTNTSWYNDYITGQPMGSGDAVARAAVLKETGPAQASFAIEAEDGVEVMVVMPDGSTARAVILPNEVLASAEAPPLIKAE